MNKSHEEQRKEFWCNVWNNVASSSNCNKLSSPTTWADEALKEFDKRFSSEETILVKPTE